MRLVANTFPDQNLKDVKAARARLRAVTLASHSLSACVGAVQHAWALLRQLAA